MHKYFEERKARTTAVELDTNCEGNKNVKCQRFFLNKSIMMKSLRRPAIVGKN